MDSPPRMLSPLPHLTGPELAEAWTEYEQALARMPGSPSERISTLHGLLADVSARLEAEQRSLVSRTLSDYATQADQPVIRRTRTERQSPADRGALASSPQRAAWELVPEAKRLGPRLAQKLVLASTRAARRQPRAR